MNPKEYYRKYEAADRISDLGLEIMKYIKKEKPVHVFEFGFGSGIHLYHLLFSNIEPNGIDISPLNVARAIYGWGLKHVSVGDETYLRHHSNYDIVFTISVLDHIEDIDGIIDEFKRMANKSIFIAETNSFDSNYYYKHDYESYGFEKLNYKWIGEDEATYHIWKWEKISDAITIQESLTRMKNNR